MDMTQYQQAVMRTASAGKGEAMEMAVSSLGLAGEAGEFADLVKKHIGHGHELDREKAAKELGDVLWYVARLAEMIGYDLEEVAQMNIDKLKKRYPEGFSTAASKARVDVVIGSEVPEARVVHFDVTLPSGLGFHGKRVEPGLDDNDCDRFGGH